MPQTLRAAAQAHTGGHLRTLLGTRPPQHLFHYTDAAGIVGISSSKELWATHIQFLNDTRELVQAADSLRTDLDNFTRMFECDQGELELLKALGRYAGSLSGGIFVASLSEHRDQLSQWRAYCPVGGYSVGFPSEHLVDVAKEQGFYLGPCVYEHAKKWPLERELIFRSLTKYYLLMDQGTAQEPAREQTALHFAQEVAQYGVLIKHRGFAEEAEWRLVSPPLTYMDTRIRHRAGPRSVVPYAAFKLLTPTHRTINRSLDSSLLVIAGPSPDMAATQIGVQSLILSAFGAGTGFSLSDTPYRK
jgi:hypothetical protein